MDKCQMEMLNEFKRLSRQVYQAYLCDIFGIPIMSSSGDQVTYSSMLVPLEQFKAKVLQQNSLRGG